MNNPLQPKSVYRLGERLSERKVSCLLSADALCNPETVAAVRFSVGLTLFGLHVGNGKGCRCVAWRGGRGKEAGTNDEVSRTRRKRGM